MYLRFATSLAVVSLLLGCGRDLSPQADSPTSPLGDAVVFLVNDKPTEALAVCDAFLATQPDHYQAILLRGEICEALGDDTSAAVAYQKAQSIEPTDSQARFRLNRLWSQDVPMDVARSEVMEAVDESASLVRQETAWNEATDCESSEVASATKTYRNESNSELSTRRAGVRYVATSRPEPNSIFQNLAQVIERGQKLDRARDTPTSLGQMSLGQMDAGFNDGETDAGLHADIQVIRFDLGVSGGISAFAPQARTSGRQSSMTSAAPQVRVPQRVLPVSRRSVTKQFC